MALIKILMCFFNFFFFAIGIALTGVGCYMYAEYNDFFSYADSQFANMSLLAVAIGAFIAMISFAGFCGTCLENKCLLTIYFSLLGATLIAVIAAGALGFVYRRKVDTIANNALSKAVKEYKNAGAKKMLDWTQQNLKCCGVSGPKDYDVGTSICLLINGTDSNNSTTPQPSVTSSGNNSTVSLGGGVPTCYSNSKCIGGDLYVNGCKTKFMDLIKENLMIVVGILGGLLLIQIFGLAFSCRLIKSINE